MTYWHWSKNSKSLACSIDDAIRNYLDAAMDSPNKIPAVLTLYGFAESGKCICTKDVNIRNQLYLSLVDNLLHCMCLGT